MAAVALLMSPAAEARIRTDSVMAQEQATGAGQSVFDPRYARPPALRPTALPQGRRGAPVPPSVAEQARQAVALLQAAQAANDEGRYSDALAAYSQVVQDFGDLALSERARVGRALQLYEAGQANQALTELEDEEVAFRGNAEVHAALAAVLYAERPAQRLRAEQQWDIACEFDRRFSDPAWAARERHWPPRLVGALDRFLKLT